MAMTKLAKQLFPIRLGWLSLMVGVVGLVAAMNTANQLAEPVTLNTVVYVQSETCQRCHPSHYESWFRTYHRTMTQTASPTAIQGDFANATYTYQGVTSRFTQENDRFFIETLDSNGQMTRFEVALTVGSRRFQQYIARAGKRHVRLPLAWNIEEGRWFHLNGGFLYSDGVDFNNHTALWDANCIFCHNVKAKPGMAWAEQTFDSRVAEFGIACEACHGPGQAHIERNANPLRRYVLYLTGRQDPTIFSPRELPKERQVQVCGHCHGQRLPQPQERIRQFLTEGDPYTVGDDLSQYTTPIWRDSHLEGVDLSLRFWPDSTPRLTAYEYQGLLQSKDYQEGDLTCISCHSMHEGDPKGMLTEAMRGPQACQSCHPAIVADIPGHTKHRPSSSGSNCYNCHMPKITYGLLNAHRTHHLQIPDPTRAWRYNMPEACTLCHTNQTAAWAATTLSEQYQLPLPGDLPDEPAFTVAENIRALLSGDVVQRAVAIAALSDEASYTDEAVTRLWAVPFLLLTLEDNYPAIRHLAYRSLKTLIRRAGEVDPAVAVSVVGLPEFDPLADLPARQIVQQQWQKWWANLDKRHLAHPGVAVPLNQALQPIPELVQSLQAAQDNKIIAIGE